MLAPASIWERPGLVLVAVGAKILSGCVIIRLTCEFLGFEIPQVDGFAFDKNPSAPLLPDLRDTLEL